MSLKTRDSVTLGLNGRSLQWWTRMQRIRTAGEVGFEFSVFTEQSFIYQDISEDARKLHRLGLSYRQIGKALKVDDKTAKKAIRRNVLPE